MIISTSMSSLNQSNIIIWKWIFFNISYPYNDNTPNHHYRYLPSQLYLHQKVNDNIVIIIIIVMIYFISILILYSLWTPWFVWFLCSDQFTVLRQMGQYYVGHAVFGLYRFKVGDLTFRIGRDVGVPLYNARHAHVILWVHT